ncbi:MAG: hypothetical protein AB7S26_09765 [Sandaracinaceae bacterium]
MPDPLMRASHLLSNVHALSDLGADVEEQVRERCGDVITEIEGAVRVAWMPLELDVRLTQTVYDLCGPERLREWGHAAITKSTEGPLLGPIVEGLRRLGMTPTTALRRVPYGWDLIYRHCGEVRFEGEEEPPEHGEHTVRLTVAHTPALLRGRSYLIGIAGAFDGVIAFGGGREGRSDHVVDGDVVTFHCRWQT